MEHEARATVRSLTGVSSPALLALYALTPTWLLAAAGSQGHIFHTTIRWTIGRFSSWSGAKGRDSRERRQQQTKAQSGSQQTYSQGLILKFAIMLMGRRMHEEDYKLLFLFEVSTTYPIYVFICYLFIAQLTKINVTYSHALVLKFANSVAGTNNFWSPLSSLRRVGKFLYCVLLPKLIFCTCSSSIIDS